MTIAHWVTGDTRTVVAQLPDHCVDLVLTSPPFLALRSYLPADHADKQSEIGSEPTPAAFLDMLLALTAEWSRVLAPHGSICVELGDTYAGSTADGGDNRGNARYPAGRSFVKTTRDRSCGWPQDKSLTLIPELYRIGLAYGINPLTGQPSPAGRWRVRNVVRWVRPNPPVGALGDKFRPATTDLVVACRARDRWFDLDAVRQPYTSNHKDGEAIGSNKGGENGYSGFGRDVKTRVLHPAGAPPLDWWNITPGGYPGAHYAVWPPALCVTPIEAMCPRRVCRVCGVPSRRVVDAEPSPLPPELRHQRTTEDAGTLGNIPGGLAREATTTGWSTCCCPGTGGVRLDGYHTGPGWRPGRVFDPFAGTGTTLAVATGHGRDAIGVDLDERNLSLARDRIGMFLHELSALELADTLRGSPVEPLSTGTPVPTTQGNHAT